MIEKERGGTGMTVRFRIPGQAAAESASVLGDFNDWSPSAHEMVRDEDGFVVEIVLPPGRSYRFRYLLDGHRWENDWAADAYVPNEFGGDDSVVDLTGSSSSNGARAV
ncbi:MAG TPA: isoamylase early set domain-containing protein [Acidimicrobiales bacterium]|nr:isoamylase early set domain-containing protein [Acidimicrobiales bacterium]